MIRNNVDKEENREENLAESFFVYFYYWASKMLELNFVVLNEILHSTDYSTPMDF